MGGGVRRYDEWACDSGPPSGDVGGAAALAGIGSVLAGGHV
jgi:hypothetical protein